MSDYSELKRLAEAALRNWPDSKLFERPECESFIDSARPDVVLALIAEVEGLRAQHGRDSAELRSLSQARDDARKERDQLKAEVEGLRKSLLDASEEIDAWGSYASDYFQEKHDLAGCVAKFHAAAMTKGAKP